ncbi:D(2) dopamine receptor [Fasciola hepatica]|uniref:D(2) dopamine receptor n=1 Tax=Fasciola hepatica TaxID=6192 RepID=A0A4E0QZQ1_FASHE|nr:D(2) dopamine receptor [Fasciola hepatica]
MQVERIGVSRWPYSPDFFIKGTSFPISASEADRMHRETLRSQAAHSINSTASPTESFQYWALILTVFPVITVFGNVLIVLSVFREVNLHTATNYFIVSLAGADIGLAIFVMPLSGWVELNNGKWRYGTIFCDVYIMLDVMLCTASILNLAAISMDRFVAVTKPIVYSRHNNNFRVSLTIALAWILSFVIALPIACGLNHVAQRHETVCVLYNPEYIITSSIGSFYIPCIIMIILYYRVFHAIHGRTKYVTSASKSAVGNLNRSAQIIKLCTEMSPVPSKVNAIDNSPPTLNTSQHPLCTSSTLDESDLLSSNKLIDLVSCLPKNITNTVEQTSRSTETPIMEIASCIYVNPITVPPPELPQTNGTKSITTDVDRVQVNCTETKEFTDMAHFRKHLRKRIRHAKRCSLSVLPVHYSTVSGQQIYALNKPSHSSAPSFRAPHSIRRKLTATKSVLSKRSFMTRPSGVLTLSGLDPSVEWRFRQRGLSTVTNPNHGPSKDRMTAKRERKATKTLAIVLGVFLICWIPFFTINITHAFCFKYETLGNMSICHLPRVLDSIAVWLGYINSSLNPIIYTIFNVEFRKAFKKLLHFS